MITGPAPDIGAQRCGSRYGYDEGYRVGHQIVDVLAADKAVGAEAEHGAGVLSGQIYVVELEQRPDEHDYKYSVYVA